MQEKDNIVILQHATEKVSYINSDCFFFINQKKRKITFKKRKI